MKEEATRRDIVAAEQRQKQQHFDEMMLINEKKILRYFHRFFFVFLILYRIYLKAGMIRATRMPLDKAAKRWINIGNKDILDQKCLPGKQGWYFLRWRGLQLLCGLDANVFRIRPSFESFVCDGLRWIKDPRYKAIRQIDPSTETI